MLAAVLSAAVLGGCLGGDRAVASWELAPGQSLGPESTTFTALVTRVSCNNGVTGSVNEPGLGIGDDAVVVTFTVSPGRPESASCPGNDAVPYVVTLPEPLGTRSLVDGACESADVADSATCASGAVRRLP